LSTSGEIIFNKEKAKMQKQAYAEWKTMISEALVRASVIKYLISHAHDPLVADKELKQQLALGFVWMQALVQKLGIYEKQRTSYPTLESYMPELVRFYDTLAPNINDYDQDYVIHCAKLVSTEPFSENDTLVSPKTGEIRFNFDKKLDGIRYFFGPSKKGIEHYPKPVSIYFSNDNKTIVMKLELKPDTMYGVNLMGRLMRTDDGYAVRDNVLHFKTTKE
jgi:Domain of unknown function (DUF4932)